MYSNETKAYVALFLVLFVVAVFLLFFIVSKVKQKKRYQHLYSQLLIAEVRTLEQERSRIAADLHDDFGQLLSVIKMQINGVVPANAKSDELIRHASANIDDTLKRLREMNRNLTPQTFFRSGSIANMQAYIKDINRVQTLQVTLVCEEEKIYNSEEKDIHLYRIIQEITNNTIKHANATRLTIHLYTSNKMVHITSNDNGCGFDEKQITAGAGLRNIHNRVALLNGWVYFSSKPGDGVQYEIVAPL